MIDGVRLQADAFFQPFLQMLMFRIDLASHDADRGAAVDLLEAFEDGPEIRFPLVRTAHVVDSQDHDTIDTVLADPLRRDQTRNVAAGIVGVVLVEVGEAVALRGVSGHNSEENEQESSKKAAHSWGSRKSDSVFPAMVTAR